jgi:hypothetical protein
MTCRRAPAPAPFLRRNRRSASQATPLRIRTEFKNPPQPSNPNPKTFPREEQGEQQQKLAHEEEEEVQERAATVRDVGLRLQGSKGAPHGCCWFENKKTDLKPLQSVELLKCNKRAPGNPALRNNISRTLLLEFLLFLFFCNKMLLLLPFVSLTQESSQNTQSLAPSLLSLSLRGAVLSLVSPTGYRTDKALLEPANI